MIDDTQTTKQEWYNVSDYKEEIQQFIAARRIELDNSSRRINIYNRLYREVFSGTEEADTERFPYAAESFKVYKAALVEACLQGYSALFEVSGHDAYSTLKIPELKQVMTEQLKDISFLEKLSNAYLQDWILKGEVCSFIKLNENREEFRVKETLTDQETGELLMRFTVKTGVSYDTIDIEYIDPLDFFVDARDYEKDPLGCTKIIRSYIDAKTLLTSSAYPFLSKTDKEAIINNVGRNGGYKSYFSWGNKTQADPNANYNMTDKDRIEVLTFYGDYITRDNKVLSNIKAVLVGGRIANCKYSGVNTLRIIYYPYFVDRQTHRGVAPLSSVVPINRLANRGIDLLLKNLDDCVNPWMIWRKGSFNKSQIKEARLNKEIEYIDTGEPPSFWTPPLAPPQGIELIKTAIEQSKNVLGINNYIAGDTSGAVRTARESAILTQKANARMRVETDAFSYGFMLPLFKSFYSLNRELAIVANRPLAPIYSDPKLNVSISTNASRADKEGELNRLMQMLQLPIAQMIFSNLQPDQIILAVRYLMAKAELTDGDNLLELIDNEGNSTTYQPEPTEPPSPPQIEQQSPTIPNDTKTDTGAVNG